MLIARAERWFVALVCPRASNEQSFTVAGGRFRSGSRTVRGDLNGLLNDWTHEWKPCGVDLTLASGARSTDNAPEDTAMMLAAAAGSDVIIAVLLPKQG